MRSFLTLNGVTNMLQDLFSLFHSWFEGTAKDICNLLLSQEVIAWLNCVIPSPLISPSLCQTCLNSTADSFDSNNQLQIK